METAQEPTERASDSGVESLESSGRVRPDKYANGILLAMAEGLSKLSKIGSKDNEIVRRHTKMILWAQHGLRAYNLDQQMLVSAWAKKDDATGEIITQRVAEDKREQPVMRNDVEYTLAHERLLAQRADVEGEPPTPFTWKEITTKFLKVPDPMTIAQLGPFADLGE